MEQTIEGFKEILTGKYDHLPEVAFYMVGDISEVWNILQYFISPLYSVYYGFFCELPH